jgi:DNA polymerase III epsilon subunit-like protein
VLFTVQNGKPTIIEQWSQVFQPARDVRAKIFALTGIRKQEIEKAPKFADFREFLQEKLQNVTLIGHSISVDIRFLQAFGIHVPERYIDTMDLVQFLLPTHHSYNLEGLMHFFRVPHPEAHRALEDAKATVAVVEKLLELFYGFPEELQVELKLCHQHPLKKIIR